MAETTCNREVEVVSSTITELKEVWHGLSDKERKQKLFGLHLMLAECSELIQEASLGYIVPEFECEAEYRAGILAAKEILERYGGPTDVQGPTIFQGGHRLSDNKSSKNGQGQGNILGGQGGHVPLGNFFCSTNHLPYFENLRLLTDLLGGAYIPILKVIYYAVVSTRIAKSSIQLGRITTDARINVLLPLISGGGKLKIKSAVRKALQDKNLGEPSSLHSEQLVGKVKERTKKNGIAYDKIAGYFSLDLLLLEESYIFWTSDDLVYIESRKYLRDALDPYGCNLITKKAVDVPFSECLSYYPHFVAIAFAQPLPIPPSRVYEGDTRRFLIPFVDFLRIDRRRALRERVNLWDVPPDEAEEEFVRFYKGLPENVHFELADGVEPEFIYFSELLVDYGFQYSEKISFYTTYKQFTIQEYLLKMAALIAFIHKRSQIGSEDIGLAFCDLFECLTLEFDFIERHVSGSLDYGVSFKGAKDKDQQCLRWLYNQGATSEQNTSVSINQYTKQICTIFGVGDRQARRNFQTHKEKKWVEDRQEQHSSKVWLAFSPEFLTPKPYHSFEEIYAVYKKISGEHVHPDHPDECLSGLAFPDNNSKTANVHPEVEVAVEQETEEIII